MAEPPLTVNTSAHFPEWLRRAGLSLAFTTYQTNRLFLIGMKPDGRLSVFERHFERPMGLWASPERLWMNTKWQLWQIDDALPEGESHGIHDRLYVPRRSWTTGHIDMHDIAVDGNGEAIFVNTAYSCLARPSERWSFEPVWKPPFISRLAPEDRCHLNGLAMEDGEPAWVTAVSRSDVVAGWRERRHAGGLVMDVRTGEILCEDLSMPHSPRIWQDRLWVLNSGTGELGEVDRRSGHFEPVAFCPGFLRGLAFHGDFALVGLSKPRREKAFTGLALDDMLREKDSDARCGLWVIDLKSGVVAHWLELEGVVVELYDVQVLEGVRCPTVLGFKSSEIERMITIDDGGRRTLHALAVEEPDTKASSWPERARVEPAPLRSPEVRSTVATSVPPPAAPPEAEAAYRDGNRLVKAGKLEAAVARYVEALTFHPFHVKALLNLGTVQSRLGRTDEAVDCYRRAIEADPESLLARTNLASVLESRGDLAGAIGQYQAALGMRPQDPDLLSKVGIALYQEGRIDEAAHALERAIRIRPEMAAAWNGLAAVRKSEENLDEALRLHEKAVELDPSLPEAVENVGKIHEDRYDVEKAREVYRRATKVRPNAVLDLHRELLCPPIFESTEALDAYRAHAGEVLAGHAGGDLRIGMERVQSSRAEPPFDWAYQGRDNRDFKHDHAALFGRSFPKEPLPEVPRGDGPIRVGFVVTPSHEGIFARCMAGILRRMDPERFHVELVCSRTGARQIGSALEGSHVRHRNLPLRFDHAVATIRRAALDFLYFWEVGTDATNHFLPFVRMAPVQVTGWGWPDTSGAPQLDAHLTSEAIFLPGMEEWFTEPLFPLPELPGWMARSPVPDRPDRTRLNLPADRHVYLCAQTLRKIHPELDPMIAGVLEADPKGIVVFVHDRHPTPGTLLQKRWKEHLPEVAERIVMLPRLSPDDYFTLIASADVALDPIYFGGALTAYDALSASVPVVTMPTGLPRGRFTQALCRKAGIDEECVATSPDDYVARAAAIGTDPSLRETLHRRILAAHEEIFEVAASVRQLEEFVARAAAKGAAPPE